MTYDLGIKKIVLEAHRLRQISVRTLEKIFRIGKSTIYRWLSGQKKKGRKSKVSPEMVNSIVNKVKADQMISLKELKLWSQKKFDQTASVSTIYRIIKRAKITYKKVRWKTKVPEKEIKIHDFKERMKETSFQKIVCLDEVGFQLEMSQQKGWSQRGSRCISYKRRKGRQNYHGIFLMDYSGKIEYKIYDKPINCQRFLDFIRGCQSDNQNNIVLDNLRVHHNSTVKMELTGKYKEILWTPSYSPEVNPIEMLFSSLKSHLRRKAVTTETELRRNIAEYINHFKKEMAVNFYHHSWSH